MIGLAHDGVIDVMQCASSVEYEEAMSIIRSGKFDFLVLLPESRMVPILREVEPSKARIIYEKECGPIPYTGGIITVLSWASFQNVQALAGQERHVYYSRLGFLKHPGRWLNRDGDAALAAKYGRLASFAKDRRVLFYGTPTAQMMSVLSGLGIRVVQVSFSANSGKLIDALVDNGCFAMAGRDGMSLQCWRDSEAALAAVPYLRTTVDHRLAELFNPFGGPTYACDDLNGESELSRLLSDLDDGTALSLAIKSRSAANMVGRSVNAWRCREALACDHSFLRDNVAAPASVFIEKARLVTEAKDPFVMDARLARLEPRFSPYEFHDFRETPDPSIREMAASMSGPAEIAELATGQKVFDNRGYSFEDVGRFSGWRYVRSANKIPMALCALVPAGAMVWIALDNRAEAVAKAMTKAGWSPAGKLKVDDPGLVFMPVFSKTFASPTRVEVAGGAMANATLLSSSRIILRSGTPFVPARNTVGHVILKRSVPPVIRNLVHGTTPVIIHRNGGGGGKHGHDLFEELIKDLPEKGVPGTPGVGGLTIASWSPSESHDRNRMQRSLWRQGTDCLLAIPCRHVDEKISLTMSLDVRTKHVLLLDMFDVVVIGNPLQAVRELERRGCKALFAAELNHFPGNAPTREFEVSKSRPPFHFLNSGCIVAEWEYLKGLLEREEALVKSELALKGTDQRAYKALYRKHFPDIQVDDECRVFQCLYRTGPSEVGII